MSKINRRKWFAVAFAAVIFVAQISLAADTIPDGDALAHFKFEGTTFSTTLNEFHRHYPAAVANRPESDEKIGLRAFAVLNTKAADGAIFVFLDQQLYSIQIVYYPERVNRMGGADLLSKKVVHAFGSPTKVETNDKGARVIWSDAGKTANLSILPEVVAIKVSDDAVESQTKERQAKQADLGF